jgi:hypothetical protein
MALTSNKRAAIHGLRQMVKDKNTPSKDKLRAIELLIELTENFTTPGLEYRAEGLNLRTAAESKPERSLEDLLDRLEDTPSR